MYLSAVPLEALLVDRRVDQAGAGALREDGAAAERTDDAHRHRRHGRF